MASFAEANDIPWVRFGKDEAKLEVMAPHLARQASTGRSGVAAIGVAQEFQRVWTASEGKTSTGTPRWSFYKADRRVTCYYFYLWDADFGPAFIKVCAYFPYPAKIWLNGHEWVKRQASRAGLGFTALSNGFAACDDPAAPAVDLRPARTRARSTCSPSGGCTGCRCRSARRTMMPATGGRSRCGRWRSPAPSCSTPRATPAASSRRWSPTTSTSAGRTTSRSSSAARSAATPGEAFRTAIDRRDNGGVLVNVFYKHSRIKQYLKDGRAMRIETVVNAPRDLGCNARLPNLDELQAKARAANRRILDAERAGQGTVLASPAFERIAHPTVNAEGRRTPALRFGDPRVMALAGALCQTLLAATGFTNKNLRVLIAGLLGSAYTPGQMTYDLRRLRLTGLIRRLPHTNRYVLTADGIRIAVFYTKVYNRLLVPLTAANQPQAPPELRAALAAITRHVDDYANRARLPRAA